jgi:hypothetical protein
MIRFSGITELLRYCHAKLEHLLYRLYCGNVLSVLETCPLIPGLGLVLGLEYATLIGRGAFGAKECPVVNDSLCPSNTTGSQDTCNFTNIALIDISIEAS